MKRLLFSTVILVAAGQVRAQSARPALSDIHSNKAVKHDVSASLSDQRLSPDEDDDDSEGSDSGRIGPSRIGRGISQLEGRVGKPWNPAVSIEQTWFGSRPAPELLNSFDGLGDGFSGPQGTAFYRNPSDNALAVGPDHIFQIVNTRMAIFTKKGKKYDT